MYGYYNVKEPPYNAKGDGVTNDTTAIQNAFDDAETNAGTVFIPRGIYIVESKPPNPENKSALTFKASRSRIEGGGTLKAADTVGYQAVLRVTGSYNVIERIRINGNADGTIPPSDGRREGLRVQGAFNHFRDLFVENTGTVPPVTIEKRAHTYSVTGIAKHNVFERCISNKAGFSAFLDSGDFNTYRDNVSLNYRRKGFSGGGPVSNRRDIHGHFATSDSFDGSAGADYDLTPANVNSLSLRNLIAITGENGGSTVKAGFADRMSIVNCHFAKHADVQSVLAFQGGGRFHVIDSMMVGDVQHNILLATFPPIDFLSYHFTTVNAISIVNNLPVHEQNAMDNVWAKRFLMRDCRLLGFKQRGINWAVPDDASPTIFYEQILVSNCLFQSQIDDNINSYDIFEDDSPPPADGELIRSSKIEWLNNVDNKQGSGTGEQLTGETAAIRGLLDMRAWRSYQATAAPTSSAVQYSVADVIWRGDPSAGGTIGWVCTSTTPAPGTFKAFGNIEA